jgi:hypothetical protein
MQFLKEKEKKRAFSTATGQDFGLLEAKMVDHPLLEEMIQSLIREICAQHIDSAYVGDDKIVLLAGGTPQTNVITLNIRDIAETAIAVCE